MTVYQPIQKIARPRRRTWPCRSRRARRRRSDRSGTGRQRHEGRSPPAPADTIAITKDNIKSTVIKDGFLKAADICKGPYAQACKDNGVQ